MAKRGAVRVSITADSSDLRREVSAAERIVSRFGKTGNTSFKVLGSAAQAASPRIGRVAAAAGAAGAAFVGISEAKSAITTTIDLAKATEGLTKNLDISVKTASEWAAVAKVRGIEAGALTQQFGILAKNEQLAKDGAQAQVDAFAKLGISQKELKNQTFNQTLGEISDGMKNLGRGTERTAISQELFGRGWKGIAPVLRAGSTEMERLLKAARDSGAVFSGKTLSSVHNLRKAMEQQKFAVLGLQVAFGTTLAPALTKVIPSVAKFINQIRTGKGAGGEFRDTVVDIVDAFKKVVKWIGNAIHNMDRFGDGARHAIFGVIHWIGKMINALGDFFDLSSHLPFVGKRFGRLADAAHAAGDRLEGVGRKAQTTKGYLDSLTHRRWPVNVDLKVGATSGVPGFKPFQPSPDSFGPHGDPSLGVEKNVARAVAQVATNATPGLQAGYNQFIQSQLGSMGGGPGAVSGTLKKAWDVARRFGLTVGSTYRTPAHNAAVGGVPGSLHTHGSYANPGATDLNGPVGDLYRAAIYARNKYHPKEDLVHDAGSGLHLHLGWFARGGQVPRKQMAVVGEKGPELVSLPQGAEVHSHTDSRSMVARAFSRGVPGFAAGGKIGLDPDVARAVNHWGTLPVFDKWARSMYHIPGRTLLARLTAGENSGSMGGNPSSAGARGAFQFIPGTRSDFIRRFGIDPWHDADSAAHAAVIHLMGKGGAYGGGLSGYNPGDPGYPSYILGQRVAGFGHAGVPASRGGHLARAIRTHKPKKPKITPAQQRRLDRQSRRRSRARTGAEGLDPWFTAFQSQADYELAQAELTSRPGDDITALSRAIGGYQGFLDVAKRRHDQATATSAAQALKSARDARDELLRGDDTSGGGGNPIADAMADLAEQTKGLKEITTERAAFEKSIAYTSKEVAIKALSDLISGQLGGFTNQRRATAGDGATVARY